MGDNRGAEAPSSLVRRRPDLLWKWTPVQPSISRCSLSGSKNYDVVEICVLVSSITPKPPRSTSQMACDIPKPRPSRIFIFLMAIRGGNGGQPRGGSGAVCRRLAPWGIGQEKLSGILVGNKRTKMEG